MRNRKLGFADEVRRLDWIDVEKSSSHQLSQNEIGSSIKGDVNKKGSPSAGSREIFCLDIQPTVC